MGRAKTLVPLEFVRSHADDLERIDQLRPGQHPDRARARDPAERRVLPDAAPGVRHADQAEAVVPVPRARGRAGRARQGLGGREGRVRLVEESDLESVALQRSQSIEILRFVKLEDVDPVYFDRTYYLAPAAADAARRPYVLLLRAMQETGMAAVGKFVLWGKENLCLIRPQGDTLAMETLFFAEDVRAKNEIEEAVEATKVQKAELQLAGAGDREPRRRVEHRRVRERVPARPEGDARGEARRRGDHAARSRWPRRPVVDLMEALRRSVADAQGRQAGDEGARKDESRLVGKRLSSKSSGA